MSSHKHYKPGRHTHQCNHCTPGFQCAPRSYGFVCKCHDHQCYDLVWNECTKQISADYVIVGFGAAAGPLARYLTDSHGPKCDDASSVLVIEYGENRTDDPLVKSPLPIGNASLTYDPTYAIAYQIGVEGTTKPIVYSEGRGWGGGTAHNGEQDVRGAPHTWNDIAVAVGNNKWTYDNMLQYFKFYENFHGISQSPWEHGTSGLHDIMFDPGMLLGGGNADPAVLKTDPFLAGWATGLNTPLNWDYNASQTLVTAVNQNASKPMGPNPLDAIRSGSYSFVTDPAVVDSDGNGLDNRPLKILSRAKVARVVFEQCQHHNTSVPRATGVEFTFYDKGAPLCYTAIARKKVIICGGAIESPALLERSGIGARDLLNKLKIPVVYDNPNVGEHCQNQYFVGALLGSPSEQPPTVGLFMQSFSNLSTTPPLTSPTVPMEYITPYPSNAQIRHIQTLLVPSNGQFLFDSLVPGLIDPFNIQPSSPNYAAALGVITCPERTGTVHIVTREPTTLPLVRYGFYQGDKATPLTDANKVIAYYYGIRQLAQQLGTPVYYPSDAQYAAGPDALLAAANPTTLPTYHWTGSCRMGKSPADSVCDSHGNVFGVEGLMIADNSIFPVSNSGNPAYPASVAGIIAAKYLKPNSIPV